MTFDVLIIGGGPVGASLACALKPSGLSVALLEAQPPPAPQPKIWDNRIYAISPGTATFLAQCNAWQKLDMSRVQPVEAMRVFGDEGAELNFSAYQLGVSELAFILENAQLEEVLWQELQKHNGPTLFRPVRCNSLVWHDDAAQLRLEDGQTLSARLVVGADGAGSWVRQQAGIVAPLTPYNQHGVVANFTTEKLHRATAFQWFQPDGILALLPLPQQMISMVWSVSPEKSATLLGLSPEELCAQIAIASHHTLGELRLITPPVAFPLRMLNPPQLVKPRLALVGDAAHSIHPLAGQGVNLGFRDVRQLAQVLLQRGAQTDCGNLSLLRRYERTRKEDVLSLLLTTDMMKRLFNNHNPALRIARNLGLAATNHITPLKKMLARHALN
ncbi:MAG: UbiH/UbiF family hydroxylase [Candidatus Nitrotoga sp.]|nr:UbiH/UbiF family hydroxylase [Candidatus Nitrotoga sp.]MBA0903217.1 UbiH/UbiF family hydroxylase [Candidatus Nitrotoga sp.]MBP0116619.1 UbiH/UbiF family hydroxylase [Candidatus Nitrotoga sp.]MBP0118580.1 UbiH/UbiF family hydroxylase [Candidatus Nitrotoga sp.]MBP0122495.1 UbiH/UbiF family hydroxylase [Candidatus Nitrotoga sp.]